MKTVLIKSDILDFDSNRAVGLISGMKLLQSKGCQLYIDIPVSKLNPLVSKVLLLEKIQVNKIDEKIGSDYIIASAGANKLIINKKHKTDTFEEAAAYIISDLRTASVSRLSKETNISVKVSLDSKEESNITTGIGFFDHMLFQIARHANIYLEIKAIGDLEVDEHHTVEDTGLALGEAIAKALGDKTGIKRYGFFLPMDDSAAYCALDLGGRAYLKFRAKFNSTNVGNFPTELTEEFFRALSAGMKSNIYIKAAGKNDHHKIESIFKAFAKALNEACRFDERATGKLPSTKGIL
jgi:imidazoleglycerol-phosphate dehydratase/histidinol-phosphatase